MGWGIEEQESIAGSLRTSLGRERRKREATERKEATERTVEWNEKGKVEVGGRRRDRRLGVLLAGPLSGGDKVGRGGLGLLSATGLETAVGVAGCGEEGEARREEGISSSESKHP